MAARTKHARRGNRNQEFLATIYRIWMMRYVDVPEAVVSALRQNAEAPQRGKARRRSKANYIPVIATVNGRSVQTTLLPAGGGRYRMQFNAELRKAAQADAGDAVTVQLVFDPGSRDLRLPPDLCAVLKQHPKAQNAFEHLPPGHRRQILKWLATVKSERARMKSIDVVIDRMLERAILKPAPRKV
jgi:Bacteriocin-protection, YdeI or OmpD-Associated/Domain of unknown function (DUF1905)